MTVKDDRDFWSWTKCTLHYDWLGTCGVECGFCESAPPSPAHVFKYLVSNWWNFWRWIKRWDLAGDCVSMVFEVPPTNTISIQLSVLDGGVSGCKLSAPALALPLLACSHTLSRDDQVLRLSLSVSPHLNACFDKVSSSLCFVTAIEK